MEIRQITHPNNFLQDLGFVDITVVEDEDASRLWVGVHTRQLSFQMSKWQTESAATEWAHHFRDNEIKEFMAVDRIDDDAGCNIPVDTDCGKDAIPLPSGKLCVYPRWRSPDRATPPSKNCAVVLTGLVGRDNHLCGHEVLSPVPKSSSFLLVSLRCCFVKHLKRIPCISDKFG